MLDPISFTVSVPPFSETLQWLVLVWYQDTVSMLESQEKYVKRQIQRRSEARNIADFILKFSVSVLALLLAGRFLSPRFTKRNVGVSTAPLQKRILLPWALNDDDFDLQTPANWTWIGTFLAVGNVPSLGLVAKVDGQKERDAIEAVDILEIKLEESGIPLDRIEWFFSPSLNTKKVELMC